MRPQLILDIVRTPRAAGLAGCSIGGALSRARGLAPWALAALLTAGCEGGNAPRVQVVNASGERLDGLWVRTEHDSARVPPLEPGESVDVKLRVKGEALLWVSGTFAGRRVASSGGDYVEGSGGYRFRAVVDSTGQVDVKFLRMGLW